MNSHSRGQGVVNAARIVRCAARILGAATRAKNHRRPGHPNRSGSRPTNPGLISASVRNFAERSTPGCISSSWRIHPSNSPPGKRHSNRRRNPVERHCDSRTRAFPGKKLRQLPRGQGHGVGGAGGSGSDAFCEPKNTGCRGGGQHAGKSPAVARRSAKVKPGVLMPDFHFADHRSRS